MVQENNKIQTFVKTDIQQPVKAHEPTDDLVDEFEFQGNSKNNSLVKSVDILGSSLSSDLPQTSFVSGAGTA